MALSNVINDLNQKEVAPSTRSMAAGRTTLRKLDAKL